MCSLPVSNVGSFIVLCLEHLPTFLPLLMPTQLPCSAHMSPLPRSFPFLHPSIRARLYMSFHLSLVIINRTSLGILSRDCIVFKESLEVRVASSRHNPTTKWPPLWREESERKLHRPQDWLVSEFPLGAFPMLDMLGMNQGGDALHPPTPGQHLLETFAFRKASWWPKTLLDLKEE